MELIDRRDAIRIVDSIDTWQAGWRGDAIESLKALPSARPEITDEQAIAHLQSSGWMQQHDKEMYESGLRERLADDSGSYDSLIPCQDTTDGQVAGKLKNPAELLLSGHDDAAKESKCKLEPCEDCISREAAIKTLQKDLLWTGYTVEAVKEDSIDLIKKLPPVTQKLPECEDAVSREDVINLLWDWICAPGERCVSTYKCLKGIRELPPVKPMRDCSGCRFKFLPERKEDEAG